MAVQLVKKTSVDMLLKLVSVADDAIDWEKTYPDDPEEDREARYKKEHNLGDLVFKEGAVPTLFVFDHPNRVDVAQKLRMVYSKSASGQMSADLFSEIYQKAYKGTEEGLDGGALTDVPRRGGAVTKDYLQMLLDADVFDELALAFLGVANKPVGDKDGKKK